MSDAESVLLGERTRERGSGVPGGALRGTEVHFTPRPPTRWFSPGVLGSALGAVVLSGLFTRFADKRELFGGLPNRFFDGSGLADPGSGEPFWIDYCADTGDGFGATEAVATALARPQPGDDGELPPGAVLLLGGDQVYPAADWDSYRDRFSGPYAAAHPPQLDTPGENQWRGTPRFMFALPGNHDWYDGLTSFTRLFCRSAWIGGYRTEQERSYFAVKLPHDYWVLAVDTQLNPYLDGPQLAYFEAVRSRIAGGRVILMVAKPYWLNVTNSADPGDGWRALAMFEQRFIRAAGAELVLTLTGDDHYFAHCAPLDRAKNREHKVIFGGGGAALSGTAGLPDEPLRLPDHAEIRGDQGGTISEYQVRSPWPSRDESKRLATTIFHPTTYFGWVKEFAPIAAVLYGVLALLGDFELGEDRSFGACLDHLLRPIIVFAIFATLLSRHFSPKLSGPCSELRRWLDGSLHALAHLVAAVGAGAALNAGLEAIYEPTPEVIATFAGGAIAGVLLAPLLLGSYMVAHHLKDRNRFSTEIFAVLASGVGRGFKGFLRIKLTRDRLVVYPLGYRSPPGEDEWVQNPAASAISSEPWFIPRDGPLPAAEPLTEQPIVIELGPA